MDEPIGIVNILKPPGMTSSNVVYDVRRLFDVKKAGHTGTLDPGAAGVLPICVGKATRLFDYLVDKRKEYIAEIAFGKRTDTQDSYGAVIETSEKNISLEALLNALPHFCGVIEQVAPSYSALKVGGQALYKLAREGKEVPRRVRQAEIFSLTCLQKSGENKFLLRIACSRGTYVRTLCQDIGTYLSTCAHMSFLLRTKTGSFAVENSYSIPELAAMKERGTLHESLIGVETILKELPAVEVDRESAFKLINGCALPLEGKPLSENAVCRVYGEQFLGMGIWEDECLKLKIRF
ncbi:tRNA pseudouridine(55) synthase TruB [Christensenellaceae bacterium OttesenSCG-928-M15]|nr:tRNA pseudouridine(55) synthase TruB [Christensenellaceae bacterium OttesenSCG-928-M15]